MKLFTWFGGVLADPADKQGSTKRVVMMLFLTNFMVLFSGVVIKAGWVLPTIPDSVIYLVLSILGAMGFLTTVDKGIAAYREVKGSQNVDATTPPAQ